MKEVEFFGITFKCKDKYLPNLYGTLVQYSAGWKTEFDGIVKIEFEKRNGYNDIQKMELIQKLAFDNLREYLVE